MVCNGQADMKPLSVIVGPTASGKSEVANMVATKLSGIVFSIDAFQIYKRMDIGTAKIRASEKTAPHELIDIADISESFSAASFQRIARERIDTARNTDRWCVLSGGTGLYLDAVIDDLSFTTGDAKSPKRREREGKSTEELYSELLEKDPTSAALLESHNKRRVIRALEMLDHGTTYADENRKLHTRCAFYPSRVFVLSWPREVLYERINKRTEKMFKQGLLEETKRLLENGLRETKTAAKAIGYEEAVEVLLGRLSQEDAITKTAQRTRHYAKRQLSWLKRDGRGEELDMIRFSPEQAASYIVEQARLSEATEEER